MVIRHLAIIGLLCGGSLHGQIDSWKPFRFLLGTWEANTKGGSAGAAAAGAYTFRLELKDHALARHTLTANCKGPADYDCEHSDLLYVYRESDSAPLRAIYFDNEGHVIRYDVTAPKANTAVFLSPASEKEPQYRLIYELKGGVMEGEFQIRAPGQTDFKPYLQWSGKKKG